MWLRSIEHRRLWSFRIGKSETHSPVDVVTSMSFSTEVGDGEKTPC